MSKKKIVLKKVPRRTRVISKSAALPKVSGDHSAPRIAEEVPPVLMDEPPAVNTEIDEVAFAAHGIRADDTPIDLAALDAATERAVSDAAEAGDSAPLIHDTAGVPPVADGAGNEATPSYDPFAGATPASAPPPKKGGWQKGRPRGPRKNAESVDALLSGVADEGSVDVRAIARENAALRSQLADQTVKLDAQTHYLVKKSLAGLLRLAGTLGARRYGTHWLISESEANETAEPLGDALIPFMGDFSQYMPWVLAAGAVYALAEPRLEMERAIAEGKAQRVFPQSPVE